MICHNEVMEVSKISFMMMILSTLIAFHSNANKELTFWHKGYKMTYDNQNVSAPNYLSPQKLDTSFDNAYLNDLYETALDSDHSKCISHHLVLGLDHRGPERREILRTRIGNKVVEALASRADSINLISVNQCENAPARVLALYRGNITPKYCMPEYFVETKKGGQNIILGNFFVVAGRKAFIKCVSRMFMERLRNNDLLDERYDENQDEILISSVTEVMKPKRGKKEDQNFMGIDSSFNSILYELGIIFLKNFSITDFFNDKYDPLKEFFLKDGKTKTINDHQKNADQIRDRSKMKGSGYERAMVISETIYTALAWAKLMNIEKDGILHDFEELFNLKVSTSLSFNNLFTLVARDHKLRNVEFKETSQESPIIVFGGGANGYFKSNLNQVQYENLSDYWQGRLDDRKVLIPAPSFNEL